MKLLLTERDIGDKASQTYHHYRSNLNSVMPEQDFLSIYLFKFR